MVKREISKYKKMFAELGLIENETEDQLIINLLKVPKRDNKIDTPHTFNPMRNGTHQLDLLFLPTDNGYKYALVVVDLATGNTDAEALKTKTSKEVLKALETIYRRKFLKLPHLEEVDAGTEFMSDFKKAFKKKNIEIRKKESGRHRQQSVVESRNAVISRILQRRMLTQEINTGEPSNEWVNFLKKVIPIINKYFAHPVKVIDAEKYPIIGSENARHILPIDCQSTIKTTYL